MQKEFAVLGIEAHHVGRQHIDREIRRELRNVRAGARRGTGRAIALLGVLCRAFRNAFRNAFLGALHSTFHEVSTRTWAATAVRRCKAYCSITEIPSSGSRAAARPSCASLPGQVRGQIL
jgi:hypothetical protein